MSVGEIIKGIVAFIGGVFSGFIVGSVSAALDSVLQAVLSGSTVSSPMANLWFVGVLGLFVTFIIPFVGIEAEIDEAVHGGLGYSIGLLWAASLFHSWLTGFVAIIGIILCFYAEFIKD